MIIGCDDMGTPEISDDVLIMADPTIPLITVRTATS